MRVNDKLNNRSFVLLLLMAFILFCMPNLSSKNGFDQTASAISKHDAPNSVTATKRLSLLQIDKLLFFIPLLLFFFSARTSPWPPYRMPLLKSIFLPLIQFRLRKLMLMPLKFTSLFVSYSI